MKTHTYLTNLTDAEWAVTVSGWALDCGHLLPEDARRAS
jgi:hypothetical protein